MIAPGVSPGLPNEMTREPRRGERSWLRLILVEPNQVVRIYLGFIIGAVTISIDLGLIDLTQ